MKPVSPVIPGENFEETIIAENQDEYQNLPAINCGKGVWLSRWELTDEEIQEVIKTKSVYLYVWTFGQPMQPVLLEVEKPKIEEGS